MTSSTRVSRRIAPAGRCSTRADVARWRPDGGTDLDAVHEGLLPGIPPEQNRLGWEQALDRLAALVATQAP